MVWGNYECVFAYAYYFTGTRKNKVAIASSEEPQTGGGDELATSGTKSETSDKARKEYVQCEHPQRAMHKNDL